MSDPQKYINAYVENAMGMIHDYTATILQLRTQLKVATELVPEKDALIASLQEQLEKITNESVGLSKSVEEAGTIRASYEAIKIKVSHMDALTSQLNEVKQALLNKGDELDKLKEENETLKGLLKEANVVKSPKSISPPKKVINKKKVTEVDVTPVVDTQPKDENDDF